jgi:hypothetical protein
VWRLHSSNVIEEVIDLCSSTRAYVPEFDRRQKNFFDLQIENR